MRLLVYISLLVLASISYADETMMTKIKSPELAVNFTLPDTQGNPISLSDYNGKYVLVNFWAHWCGPCVKEMPDMQTMYESLKDQQLEIIAIHAGPFDSNVSSFLADKGITFPVVMDEKTNVKGWKVPVLPMSYLISPEGKYMYKAHGAINWNAASMVSLMSSQD